MGNIITEGSRHAKIVVVTDAPSERAWKEDLTMSDGVMSLFVKAATDNGFKQSDFCFLTPCPPIPEQISKSESRKAKFLAESKEEFDRVMRKTKPKCVITLGNLGSRQYIGRAVKITKLRGVPFKKDSAVVFPMFAPGYCLAQPEQQPLFHADFVTLRRLVDSKYNIDAIRPEDSEYKWCTDLAFLLKKKPKVLAVDTEGTGLRWYKPETELLTVQLTWAEGKSAVIPVHYEWWTKHHKQKLSREQFDRCMAQLRKLLGDRSIKKVGHNFKFDVLFIENKLGMKVRGWSDDTMQLFFAVDENAKNKSLDDAARRFVPALAGYNDWFDYDKNDMWNVPLDDFLQYAGGDTDATFRLRLTLLAELRKDKRQLNCYRKIMMPGLQAFAYVVERNGTRIDQKALKRFGEKLVKHQASEYKRLIRLIPNRVKVMHREKGLAFSRADFIRDILFHRRGFNLEVYMHTPSTQNLENEDERIPSINKSHLAYHKGHPFVDGYLEYNKTAKMISTYVKGFDKYLQDGMIFPTFWLSRTNTGRSASSDPNGQNIPKRGKLAKAYRETIVSMPAKKMRLLRKGYLINKRLRWKLLSLDFSQIELRLVACMAKEPTMLRVYKEGGDIHQETGISTANITLEEYMAKKEEEREQIRFQAKAVNFGLIYGMGWRKFQVYAFTDYNIELSEERAQEICTAYFEKYPMLPIWHEIMREFVREHGFVRAMHGAVRHLPNIWSDDRGIVSATERQAINAPIQRFGSDLGIMAMTRIARCAPREFLRPNGFIHDAVTGLYREDKEEEVLSGCKYIMENLPLERDFGLKLPIPLVADVEAGFNSAGRSEEKDKNTGEVIILNPFGMTKMKHIKSVAPSWYNEAA